MKEPEKERLHLNLARLKKKGLNFEINVNPKLALKYKKGKDVDLREVLKSQNIFRDVQRGDLANEHDMKRLFGTKEPLEVAEKILEKGEIQLTSEYRERLREKKEKKIVNTIHKYGVDPRTDTPHPVGRIRDAIEEAGIHIDEQKSASDQVKEVVDELKPILPIKFEIKEVKLHITAEYAPKAYSIVDKFSNIKKEEWLDDGSWKATVEIPGGLEEDFYDKLNSLTHGNIEAEEVKSK